MCSSDLFDAAGQPLASTFVDYLLPGAGEVPDIEILHMETPSPISRFGQKGIGEGGAIAPPAAIANALADALRPLAPRVNEIPLTPDRVVELFARSRARRSSWATSTSPMPRPSTSGSSAR